VQGAHSGSGLVCVLVLFQLSQALPCHCEQHTVMQMPVFVQKACFGGEILVSPCRAVM